MPNTFTFNPLSGQFDETYQLPDQTGHAGAFLGTNGLVESWNVGIATGTLSGTTGQVGYFTSNSNVGGDATFTFDDVAKLVRIGTNGNPIQAQLELVNPGTSGGVPTFQITSSQNGGEEVFKVFDRGRVEFRSWSNGAPGFNFIAPTGTGQPTIQVTSSQNGGEEVFKIYDRGRAVYTNYASGGPTEAGFVINDGTLGSKDALHVHGVTLLDGDTTIQGKLTVTGAIDPTSLTLTPQSIQPTPAVGLQYVDDGSNGIAGHLYYSIDGATFVDISAGGGGGGDLVSATLATASGATASTTNNSAGFSFNIPVTGVDMTVHGYAFAIDGNILLTMVGIGDGAGGVNNLQITAAVGSNGLIVDSSSAGLIAGGATQSVVSPTGIVNVVPPNQGIAYQIRTSGGDQYFLVNTTSGAQTIELGDPSVNPNIVLSGQFTSSIPDNNFLAYTITQGASQYFLIATANGNESVSIGNTLINPTININGGILNLSAGNGGANISITDNLSGAFVVNELTHNYIEVDTNDGGESITLGNTVTSPVITVLGSFFVVDNAAITLLKDPTFTQPFSPAITPNTYGVIGEDNSGTGGMQTIGVTSDASKTGLLLVGLIGSTTPTAPAVKLVGGKSDGAGGVAAIGASEALLEVNNALLTPLITVLGNGNMGIGVTIPTAKLHVVGTDLFAIPDNTTAAFSVKQGSDLYIEVNTNNDSENITFGNSLNPQYNFVGTGSAIFSGPIVGFTGLTVTGIDLFSVPDNTTNAFSIRQGSDSYFEIDTNNGGEGIFLGTGAIMPSIVFLGKVTASVRDNDTAAFDVGQASDSYIHVSTQNAGENVTFGNFATNPYYAFQGSGTVYFGADIRFVSVKAIDVTQYQMGISNLGNNPLYIHSPKGAVAGNDATDINIFTGVGADGTGVLAAGDGGNVNITAAAPGTNNGGGAGIYGAVNSVSGATSWTVRDTGIVGALKANTAQAFNVAQGADYYINVNTTTGSAVIQLGNAAIRPSQTFIGKDFIADFSESIALTGNDITFTATGNDANVLVFSTGDGVTGMHQAGGTLQMFSGHGSDASVGLAQNGYYGGFFQRNAGRGGNAAGVFTAGIGGNLLDFAGDGGASSTSVPGGDGGKYRVTGGTGGVGSASTLSGYGGNLEFIIGIYGATGGFGVGQHGQYVLNDGLSNNYVIVNPNTPRIDFGNTGNNPAVNFLGTGAISFSGNITKINNVTTSFPASQGAANTALTNDGSGNLSWTATPGILKGTATLVAGTVTITAAITANSRIVATIKDASPGAGNLTIGLAVPSAGRNVGGGTFAIQANVAAGTINVLDTSTVDWVVIG